MSSIGYWKKDVHMKTERELREMHRELLSVGFIELMDLPWDSPSHSTINVSQLFQQHHKQQHQLYNLDQTQNYSSINNLKIISKL